MKQTAPCGETLTNAAPAAFSLNQNGAVCLPLVSDGHKLIWVHSNQIDLQMEGAAELDKAFDLFPYQTQKQTAALAQRCSLHPDQVKVWFMVQRLRYGISWDYKDIRKIQRKFNRGKDKLQNRALRKEKDRKVEEHKKNTLEKKKKPIVADKLGKKRVKQGDEGVVERAGDVEIEGDEGELEWQKSTQIATPCTRKKKKKEKQAKENQRLSDESCVGPDELLDANPVLASNQTPNVFATPVTGGFKGKTKVKAELEGEKDAPTTQIRWCRKTRTQLAMLKAAFVDCQYPDSYDYSRLEMLTAVPRCTLVQWFGDMRYYIKKKRPCWMNQEQHRQALANINYQQCLSRLSKVLPGEGGGRATWEMKLEIGGSKGEDESVQVPREENDAAGSALKIIPELLEKMHQSQFYDL